MSYEKLEVTKGLMEAYVAMNASHEENISEEVEDLIERGNPGAAIAATQQRQTQAQAQSAKQGLQQGKTFGVAGNFGMQSGTKVKMDSSATRSQGRTVLTSTSPQGGARGGTSQSRPNQIQLGGQKLYAAKLGGKDVYVGAKKPGQTPAASSASTRPATTPRPSATPPATPRPSSAAPASASAGSKVAPSGSAPATKPAAPKGDAMSQWAAANPKLAAAKAERDRTRGTSATTNPLMKDMKSSLPAPKAPSPTTTSTAFKSSTPSLGSSSSAVQSAGSSAGAKAFPVKPATSSQATSATTKPVAPEVKATNTAAAAPKPITPNPSGGAKSEPMKVKPLGEEIDIFDTVLEYLISEGYAETVAEAEYLMTTLDIDVIDNIVEAKYGTKTGRKKLAKKIRKGENIGKKGPGTGFKAVEKAAEKGGAEDPAAVAAAQMWKTHGK